MGNNKAGQRVSPLCEVAIIGAKRRNSCALSFVGISAILELTKSEVELLSSVGAVRIWGSDLTLLIFENKTLEVRGKIDGVEFK